jgi:phage-related protein (TIGR01555 family)
MPSQQDGKTVGFKIHESRVLRFDGAKIPDISFSQNGYWHDSIYQAIYRALASMGTAYSSAGRIVDEFLINVLSMDRMDELLASPNGMVQLQARLHHFDMTRSIHNTTAIDTREQFNRNFSSVTGLGDLLDRFGNFLSAVTGIPFPLLMGQSPAGLNATGASDIRFWYDRIASDQKQKLMDPIERLIHLNAIALDGPTRGKEPEWNMSFNSLWQMTDAEKATIRTQTAQTDSLYIQTGVLMESEVRLSRFGGNTWSMETTIDQTLDAEPETPASENP